MRVAVRTIALLIVTLAAGIVNAQDRQTSLEMRSLLRAMVARVRHIEVGEPVIAVNNTLRGYKSFRVSFR